MQAVRQFNSLIEGYCKCNIFILSELKYRNFNTTWKTCSATGKWLLCFMQYNIIAITEIITNTTSTLTLLTLTDPWTLNHKAKP